MATLQDKNHMEELASAVTRGACEGALHMRLLADRVRRWRGLTAVALYNHWLFAIRCKACQLLDTSC